MLQAIENYLNKGYYCKGSDNKEIAILMIHGFAASPVEFQPLFDHLKNDFDIYAPILPGHKTNIEDFSKQKYVTWLDFSEKIYNRLLEEYSKVVLLGFSMGGTICLYLATKKEPYKLVTLSAPINFLSPDFGKILLAGWKRSNISLAMILSEIKEISKKEPHLSTSTGEKIRYIVNNIYKKISKEFTGHNKEMLAFVDTYEEISFAALQEIFKLVKFVRTQISVVDSDILVIHSKLDSLIPLSNAKEIIDNISSNDRELFMLENSGHNLLLDTDHKLVFRKVKEFLKREKIVT